MPVFIALHWVLMESVELRQAPFALWIDDLSVMDPYFVLPILMGASMYYMQKLNPAPPTQCKRKSAMDADRLHIFLLVVSGWSCSLLAVQQPFVDGAQYIINRRIENGRYRSRQGPEL